MDLFECLIGIFVEYGYVLVFIVLLLCGVGVLLLEDIILVVGGVIVGFGYVNVYVMVGVIMVGVLVGDVLMFLFGYYFGVCILCLWLFVWLLLLVCYVKV